MPNPETFPSCQEVYLTGDRHQHSCSFRFERSPLTGTTRDGEPAWLTFTQALNLLAREALYRALWKINNPPLSDQEHLTLKINRYDPELGTTTLLAYVGTWPDLRGTISSSGPRSSAKISFGVDEVQTRREPKILPPMEREVSFSGRDVCVFLDRPSFGQSESENQAASREVARITGTGLLKCLTAKGVHFSLWAGERQLSEVFDTADKSTIEVALTSVDKEDLYRPTKVGLF